MQRAGSAYAGKGGSSASKSPASLPTIPIVGRDCSCCDRAIIPVEVSTWRTGQQFNGETSLAARNGDLQCGGEGCGVVKPKILVGTSDGLHVAGEPSSVEFAGREVRSLVRTDAESWGDRRQARGVAQRRHGRMAEDGHDLRTSRSLPTTHRNRYIRGRRRSALIPPARRHARICPFL